MEALRKIWKQSKWFRILLIIALIWFMIRLAFQFAYLSDIGKQWSLAADMQVFKLTSERLINQEEIYHPEEVYAIEYFQYAPSYALVFFPISRLSVPAMAVGWTLIQILFYFCLWQRWDSLLAYLGLFQARNILVITLPLWLFFSQFWADLAYGNVYILMALLSTLLLEAVLKRRLGWSILWLAIILQIKPQCSFAILIPLCQREFKFLFRLLAGAGLAYLGCMGLTMLAIGPSYVLSEYLAYIRFLLSLNSYFPWTKLPFLGYNHSILQTLIHFTGWPLSTATVGLTALIKVVLLAPLVWVSWRFGQIHRPQSHALILALGWYLGIYFVMDIVWEVTLVLPILALIWPMLHVRIEKWILAILISLYIVLDLWQIVSYLIWGDAILWQGSYVLTDPAIYVPIILLVLLALYVVVLRFLFIQQMPSRQIFSSNIETM